MINIIQGWAACEGIYIALQDSFPNTHIELLIVTEAQVSLSKNIGGIVNLIIGQRNKGPSRPYRSFCSH